MATRGLTLLVWCLPSVLLLSPCCAQTLASHGPANVRDYGAVGDGVTDDTAAIEAAWAYVRDVRKPEYHARGTASREYVAVNEPALYFPPGVYLYNGQGLDAGEAQVFRVCGDGFNQARIMLTNEVYFLTCGRVESTIVEGLSFVGGKGVFRSTWTGNMVGGRHIFRDCYFVDYSECAIGNNADDSPYLSVADCIFFGRAGSPSTGIAWGGYLDDGQITRCAFEQNKYHIKLGDRLGGNIEIGPRNSFFSWGGTRKEADIWFVPNSDADSWGGNSGQGTIVADNKFGNENRDPDTPRILIALEDRASGADRLSRQHSTTVVAGQGSYVTGVRIVNNNVSGGGTETRGFVYSYIQQAALVFDHNYHYGSGYPYLIEFAPGIERLQDHTTGNTTYVYSQEQDNKEWNLLPDVSNLPGYAIPFDPDVGFAGCPEVPSVWQRGDDPGYKAIVSLVGRDVPVYGNAGSVPAADAHGGNTAALVTANGNGFGLAIGLDDTGQLEEGRVGFIEVEIKGSDALSAQAVLVWLVHNIGVAPERARARTVRLAPQWQRITIPFVVRNLDAGAFHLALLVEGFEEGLHQSFVCGNVRVYHASAPHSGSREGIRSVGDEDAVVTLGVDPQQIYFAAPLSSDHTLVFATPHPSIRPLPGTQYRVTRAGGGMGVLNVGGLTTLEPSQWCEIIHDGVAYCVTAKGQLK